MTLLEKQQLLNSLILEARLRMPPKMEVFKQPKRYKAAYGGRGGGKSESYAKLILDIANKEAGTYLCGREIQNSIADSVHSLLARFIHELNYTDFKVTDKEIYNTKVNSNFIFKGLWLQDKKQTIKSLDKIKIAWIEEAQTVSKASLDLLDPTIRAKESELWFTFNRLTPDDPIWLFLERIEPENKIVQKINYYDNPYLPEVLLQQALRAKKEFEDSISDDYLHIWEGEPLAYSERAILSAIKIQHSINRIVDNEGAIQIGADIARFGKDRTVFFKRKGLKITDWKVYKKHSITDVARLLIDFVGQHNTHIPIKIDDTGLGGGVTDYLRDYGYNVEPIVFGGKSNDPDKYANIITEMWFYFKSIIDQVSLPDLQELRSELATREFKIDLKGRKQVESKEEYKKKFAKSPDLADACLLCYYDPDTSGHYFGKGI